MKTYLRALLPILLALTYSDSYAIVYGGVDFPAGEVSFADEWILYEPTNNVLAL